jgi:hypothetical protein
MKAATLEATDAMVVVMEERATAEQVEKVVARLVEMGMDVPGPPESLDRARSQDRTLTRG